MLATMDVSSVAQVSSAEALEGAQPWLKVLLVEGDPARWQYLKCALEHFAIECIVAESLASALRLVTTSVGDGIDAVLLNPSMPDGQGEDLLPDLEGHARQPGIVILSDTPEQLRPDARSYRALFSSRRTLPASLAAMLRSTAHGYANCTVDRFAKRFGLTSRESEILHRLAGGMSTKKIALVLGCSLQAVYARLAKIGKKTECRGCQEIIAKLFRFSCHGLGHSGRGG